MKGDFTRSTFKREKHYSSVRLQQGRVQLDAEWNEQCEIHAHHEQTISRDVIGPCGVPLRVPLHEAGFSVKPRAGIRRAPPAPRGAPQPRLVRPLADNLVIGQGRYYVDGVLCENEKDVLFTKQPDFPGASLPTQEGLYLAYMDVWEHHITALEDPQIREVALGGPDTTTRTKVVWQVRLVRVGDVGSSVNCLSEPDAWLSEVAPSTGRIQAQSKPSAPSPYPCIIPPSAGYRRLENQLYRVEIHKGGELGKATFKWSRDNGSIVTSWLGQDDNDLIVGSVNRDQVLSFVGGLWVELSDDGRELRGEPGTLVRLIKAEGQILTIDPVTATPTGPVNRTNFPINPKVRRWDSAGEIIIEVPDTNEGWIPLEDGIEVKFEDGSYKTGDYWLIPARTATGDVEWPRDSSNQPKFQLPHGIQHHYCRLALLELDGAEWRLISDCRQLFPPLTELTSFFYVSGDGQETMPGEELNQPLQVGVANGQWPVADAQVKFRIIPPGEGRLKKKADTDTIQELVVSTGPDGLAECFWILDTVNQIQRVEATLLNADDKPIHLPIRFNANLSRAEAVAYDPRNCTALKGAGVTNLQAAVDQLCQMESRARCAVTVGKGAQYPSLDKAIEALRKADQRNICICMLPGDHVLPSLTFTVQPDETDLHLKIVGCGPGTRIDLGPKGQLKFEGLASFTLKDIEIKVPSVQNPIVFEQCREVMLGACHLTGVIPERGALLTISGADNILLENNTVEAYLASALESPKTNLRNIVNLQELFTVADRKEFTRNATSVAKELAKLHKSSRRKLVADIKLRFGANIDASVPSGGATASITLSKLERKSYDTFLTMMDRETVDPRTLAMAILNIRDVTIKTMPALALVIMDAHANTTLENNEIIGILSLYGMPAGPELSELNKRELMELAEKLKQDAPAVTFLESTGALHLRNNRLTRQVVAGDMVRKLRELSANEGKLEGVYKLSFLTENLIEAGKNQFVAKHLVLTSNSFQPVGGEEADLGTVIGQTAIFMGNHSTTKAPFHNLSCSSDEAANLINIS